MHSETTKSGTTRSRFTLLLGSAVQAKSELAGHLCATLLESHRLQSGSPGAPGHGHIDMAPRVTTKKQKTAT